MKLKGFALSILFTLFIVIGARASSGAITLRAGEGIGSPGLEGLVIPIDLTSEVGTDVAALNFNLYFDANQLVITDVSAGSAAVAAGKEVVSSLIDAGTVRVVVYGLNQSTIGDGTIVNIVFNILPNAALGATALDFGLLSTVAHPDASPILGLTAYSGSINIESASTFLDVPRGHWAYDYIEALYQQGYVAGCSTTPLLYCPGANMTRAESAVFVERGIWNANYLPPQPTAQVFSDVALGEWFAKWANGLWGDGYTAGCGTNPLVFCPLQENTRAEGAVFFLRMMHGANYVPPSASGIFEDVDLAKWYAPWVEAAYNAGLLPPCATDPGLRICAEDALDRAMGAFMMVQAKGLSVP
ncbi:MAG: S-layer homology domain-containing protein [Chloroflexi bacterium]|nr:S-layer homology domain-containing protein [Chloroflexota bacterium]